MSTETVLLISAPQDFANRFEVKSLGLTLCNQADRLGVLAGPDGLNLVR